MGLFFTTASFASDAIDFASRIDSKVILIDRPTLAMYLIDNSVDVSLSQAYEVKKMKANLEELRRLGVEAIDD
jgi:restriction system protein